MKMKSYADETSILEYKESLEHNPSDPTLLKLEKVLENYESGDESLLIPLLQIAQSTYGYLSMKVLDRIADHLQVSRSRVYSVATFYTQFHLTPCGENVIRVCTGTGCYVKGGKKILDVLENKLGIKAGETTPDLKFSLETVACLGTCFLSPVMVINGKYFGKLTSKKALEIVDQYRQQK